VLHRLSKLQSLNGNRPLAINGRPLSAREIRIRYEAAGFAAEEARCCKAEGGPCRYLDAKPRYDPDLRLLWFCGIVIRHFSRRAWNQMAVLEGFQKIGWGPRIPDPTAKTRDSKYENRQKKLVTRLNHGELYWLVRFHGHFNDQEISWEANFG